MHAQAPIRTLLSLPRYARIMGINPVTFQSATAGNLFPIRNACADLWWAFSWQNTDHVSRDDLAIAIHSAEVDLADFLGYWPAPVWIAEEEHPYPQGYRKAGAYEYSIGLKSVPLDYGKVLNFGQRGATFVATATVAGGTLVYSDEDGDGFDETATLTIPVTGTTACDYAAFVPGEDGDEEWEIRGARSITISGGNVIFVFDAWLLVQPELQQAYPTAYDPVAINLTDPTVFLQSVDIYYIYNDNSVQGQFLWEPGLYDSCTSSGCSHTTQDACVYVRDHDNSLVVLQPAAYSRGTWTPSAFSDCRQPDKVKIWYQSGLENERYKRGKTCDPLPDDFAYMIAMMATARLERPACSCGNLTALFVKMQEDMAMSGERSFMLSEELMNCPFGTRRGEIEAYRKVSRLKETRVFGVAL